jgi:PHP family Zn ribbon phosphoesterase
MTIFKECPVCRTYVLEDYDHIYMKCRNCGQLIVKTKEVAK